MNSAPSRAAARYRGSPKPRAGLGQRADHQRVPAGQALVVEARPDAGRAHVEQPPADLRQPLRALAPRFEHQRVLERLWAEVRHRFVVELAERVAQLGLAPRVELPLDALGVGVERRAEAALGSPEIGRGPSRASSGTPPRAARRPRPASRAGTRPPAARCRRASSRSGGRSRWRRPSSGRSRRRAGRRCRRRPSTAGCAAPAPARRARAAARSTGSGGNFGARPQPPFCSS